MDKAVACTLSGPSHAARLGEIQALTRESLLGVDRRDLTLELRYRVEAAAEVGRIASLEQQCCAFLDFEISATTSAVCLTITAPEGARGVADELFALYLPRELSSARGDAPSPRNAGR